MLIDCDACRMRNTDACDDCVVTFLLATGPFELSADEEAAIEALSDEGLVPRLRLVAGDGTPRSAAG